MNEYMITMDSFGSDCPENWEEIAAYLNAKIDAIDPDDEEFSEKVNNIWESYWNGDYADAPAASENLL